MGGIFYITGALADSGVTTAKIADNAVTTAKITDVNVTTAKIADDAVTADKLASSAVVTASIVDNAVTAAKINDGAVTNAKIDTMAASKLTGALPAISGASLTGIVAIPTGGIILWSGAANAIPTGFVICDGNNSTPDLRNRFVVGAGDTYSVDGTGGATTDSINISTYTSNAAQQTGNVRRTDQGAGTYMAFKTHAHQFSVQATIDTVPPYYALCYIMKT